MNTENSTTNQQNSTINTQLPQQTQPYQSVQPQINQSNMTAQQIQSPITQTIQTADPTILAGAKRTTAPTAYQAANTNHIKAIAPVEAEPKKLFKSNNSIFKTINDYYNKYIVNDCTCPHCGKYSFKAIQPDDTKVRCPNCKEDSLIKEMKALSYENKEKNTEKLLFLGLALIIVGFFIYIDKIVKFFVFLSFGLMLCIPKLQMDFKFNKKVALYAAIVLLLIPIIMSILLK